MKNQYQEYLVALKSPYRKLTKLEFLQPDDSVAFFLDNKMKIGYNTSHDSRAFIQSGTLNVSLQNGARRKASITLANLDGAFEYSVNKLWYGSKIRLSMGLVLPDGTDFYLPQGVFYLQNPQRTINPNQKEISYQLVDKWSRLDGTLLGTLPYTYVLPVDSDAFEATQSILNLSQYDLKNASNDPLAMIDSKTPVFTTYYSNLPDVTYRIEMPDGSIQTKTVKRTQTPYEIREELGSTLGALLLKINDSLVGWIGYDPTGALRIDSATEELSDAEKPVLWTFSLKDKTLFGISENDLNSDVCNDVIVTGEGIYGDTLYGRATNYDPSSETNVNLIGLKTEKLEKPEYWNYEQCIDFAKATLKRKTILQKSVSIQCAPVFHLIENRLVAIQRTDKPGSPIETHLINSFSIPLGETGSMTINATSVQDIEIATVTSSNFSEGLAYTASGGSYSLTGIGTCTDVEIYIPPTYQGVDVTAIGTSAFQGNTDIQAVYIPNSVRSIGHNSFRGCTNMEVVSLPTSIQSMGHAGFYGCTAITSISLPPNLSDIPTYIFWGCSKLANVSIPDGVSIIKNNAFQNCSGIQYAVLPSSLTEIGASAFSNCSSLTSVFFKGNSEQFSAINVSTTGNTLFTSANVFYYSATKPTTAGNYWYYLNGQPTAWNNTAVSSVSAEEV